jgi:bifunctional ADP-heptose synthase (sugar kinase/adenylyltransferase)
VLAALASVDMVVLFGSDPAEGDKPVKLIEALAPDIFFKGGDYTEAQLPEAPVVRAYGGAVEILSLVQDTSTSATIAKIRQK